MITLETRDSHIWDLNNKTIEILKECLTGNRPIIICMNSEGPCLRSCGLYDLLDHICKTFHVNKDRFEIRTSNVEEFVCGYKIVITPNIWVNEYKKYKHITAEKDNTLTTIGCFVGKLNWARLSLLAWLDQFPDNAFITCHYANDDITHQSSLQLNQIMTTFPDEIKHVSDFLTTCPRLLTTGYAIPYKDTRGMTLTQCSDLVSGIASRYTHIFADLVCETYFSGLTFFPTEKTFRPMQQLTPFIVQGPIGFLENLKRCGFKTFENFWNEDYDNYQSVDRIIKIRQLLLNLFKYSPSDLSQMYQDMLPILQHNKDRFLKLCPIDLLFDTQKNDQVMTNFNLQLLPNA